MEVSMKRLMVQHPSLSDATVSAIAAHLGAPATRLSASAARWEPVDLTVQQANGIARQHTVDAALTDPRRTLADFRLIAFDMDSTLITIECIDEMADFVGKKAEVAAITKAAMRGEIADYDESLRRRVALLAGSPQSVLQSVYDQRLNLSPGAQTLIDAAKAAGLKVLLVSGGFTFFTARLQQRLGIDVCHANELAVADGKLSGQVNGEIVNAQVKKRVLLETCERYGCTPQQAIAVGDGANDLLMMGAAGLSVAYHAKPVVQSQANYAIVHSGLDAVVNLFG
jgi:phosphoserine phosphatase